VNYLIESVSTNDWFVIVFTTTTKVSTTPSTIGYISTACTKATAMGK
jgi:predicted thioesterase